MKSSTSSALKSPVSKSPINLSNIKMIFSDVDDTLVELASTDYTTQETNLINQIKNNHQLTLISGRCFTSIANLLTPQINYFVGVNGAFIYDNMNKKMIQHYPINVKKYTKQLYNQRKRFVLVAHNKIWRPPFADFSQDPFLKPHWNQMKKFYSYPQDEIYLLAYYFLLHEKKKKEQIIKLWKKRLQGTNLRVNLIWSFGFFIQDYRVSKYKAIEYLTNYLGLSKNEILFIGDGPNDVPVFEKLENSICVGDNQQVCRISKYYKSSIYDVFGKLDGDERN